MFACDPCVFNDAAPEGLSFLWDDGEKLSLGDGRSELLAPAKHQWIEPFGGFD